jgi:integrase
MARKTAAKLHLLTVREVQTAPEGDHSDGGGLLLRVRGDSASWVLRYTATSGRRREMGLGVARRNNSAQTGDSLTTARKLAHEARDLLQRGGDPIDERDSKRDSARLAEAAQKAEKTREQMTLARAARDYHERVIEPTRTTKHAAQWISSLENHMPAALWHAPVDSIEPPALLAALTAIKPHERARNLTDDHKVAETVQRIRQRLDAIFEDAIFHKRCTSNPAAAIKRKMREAQDRRQRGEFKALAYREAPAFMLQLREAEGTAARCLELAVLTAARTTEALLAEWSEFDLDAATWIVPAERMKAKEAHTVHLSPRAVEILKGQLGQHADLAFPSPMLGRDGRARPLSNMAMLTVLDRMGMRERTTAHGLCRATFSTWANETGAARPDVIEACLAHEESNRVRAAYNRAQFTQERAALMVAWAEYLSTVPASNVVPLKAA